MLISDLGGDGNSRPKRFLRIVRLPELLIYLPKLKVRRNILWVILSNSLEFPNGILILTQLHVLEGKSVAREGVLRALLKKAFQNFDSIHLYLDTYSGEKFPRESRHHPPTAGPAG